MLAQELKHHIIKHRSTKKVNLNIFMSIKQGRVLVLQLLFVLFCLLSCNKEGNWKTYTINKGNHSSGIHGKICYHKSIAFQAIFDQSAEYEIGKDQSDINKLYGFSEGVNHRNNSARFGWRWFNNRIEILAYTYVDGKFYFKYIDSVNAFEENTYQLRATDKYMFKVNNTIIEMERGESTDNGYYLYPYFGGNCVAPHNITIKIKEER